MANESGSSGLPSVGVAQFDEDHNILAGVLAQMTAVVADGEPAEVVASAVIFFCDYTLTHFRREERVLERTGYPPLAIHRVLHQDFVRWIDQFRAGQEAVPDGKLIASSLGYARRWLENHVNGPDMAYSEFLAARADEVAAVLASEDLFEIYGFDPAEDDDDPLLRLSEAALAIDTTS